MPFLPPNKQRQSTEGNPMVTYTYVKTQIKKASEIGNGFWKNEFNIRVYYYITTKRMTYRSVTTAGSASSAIIRSEVSSNMLSS